MAKLPRVISKIFGSSAPAGDIDQFGSFASGSTLSTTDPTLIQALANFLAGWKAAILGNNSPTIEDMNALFYLLTYQITYGFQAGVPEWQTSAIYFIGSLVNDGFGNIYVSLTDNNTGNALTSTANWAPPGGANKTKTANYTLLATDASIAADATAGDFTLTLPLAANNAGRVYYLKKTDASPNVVTLARTGADLIDGETSQLLQGEMAGLVVRSDGSAWYVY